MTEYEFKYGRKTVEKLLDAVLSIEEHIDPNFFMRRVSRNPSPKLPPREGRYDDLLRESERPGAREKTDDDAAESKVNNENLPEKDLLFYIMRHSPTLSDWQRDVIAMIHEEMEYFVPQMQTKTINEGWASLIHSRIMRELDLSDNEMLEFAELHSGVVSPHKGSLNPYYVGYKIFEDIERRWDNPTPEEQERFGRKPGGGRAKILEVRELESDVSFLRNYLTEELCEELDLYVMELVDEEDWTVTEKRWERVRDQLVANMTNFGFPYIVVADGDYNNNRELYLRHEFEGSELDGNYARKVLEHVHTLWGRPVHLETFIEDEQTVLTFDGHEHDEHSG